MEKQAQQIQQVTQGHLIRGTQQTASGGRLHNHGAVTSNNAQTASASAKTAAGSSSLVDSQNIHASGNVINNNFNIINNFMGSLPPEAANGPGSNNQTNTTTTNANNRANSASVPTNRANQGVTNPGVFNLNPSNQ